MSCHAVQGKENKFIRTRDAVPCFSCDGRVGKKCALGHTFRRAATSTDYFVRPFARLPSDITVSSLSTFYFLLFVKRVICVCVGGNDGEGGPETHVGLLRAELREAGVPLDLPRAGRAPRTQADLLDPGDPACSYKILFN